MPLPCCRFASRSTSSACCCRNERILLFLYRPSFRTARRPPFFRGRQLREGILVVTDRQVLFMEDTIPPGITMVHWGYRAVLNAVERIEEVAALQAGEVSRLLLTFWATGGRQTALFEFPASFLGASLAEQSEGDYVDKLIRALEHPEPSTPVRAATILGKIGDPRAVGPLARLALHAPDPYIAEAAVQALAAFEGEAVASVLRQVQNEGAVPARRAAREALCLRGHDAPG